MSSQNTLLVTGASGHLGRRVLELLLDAGENRLIATSRTPEKLADLAARGVDVRHASFDEPASLTAAFAGANRLLLISTDAVGAPGVREKQHLAAVQAAIDAGVSHVVYTSLTSPFDTPITLAPDHAATERALEASQAGYTILRNNLYADGLPRTLEQAKSLGGNLYSAIGDGRAAYVTREDCAQAAAAALASSFEGRRVLDITGPEALSQPELASIAATVLGQSVTYVPLTADALAGNLAPAGLPEPIVKLIVSFDEAVAQGKLGTVSTDFEALTGRKPTRVADFLAAQAGA